MDNTSTAQWIMLGAAALGLLAGLMVWRESRRTAPLRYATANAAFAVSNLFGQGAPTVHYATTALAAAIVAVSLWIDLRAFRAMNRKTGPA